MARAASWQIARHRLGKFVTGVSLLVGAAQRVSFRAGQDGPARREPNYGRTGWAFFSGSQILMCRVSGMMNRQMMKHTAGTTMG